MPLHLLRRGARLLITVGLLSTCNSPIEPSDLIGTWGGEHVEITFDSGGAAVIQYDCAHGRMGGPITLSAAGVLSASGEHIREHGGPVQEGEVEDPRPAHYSGEVRGDRLTFTVTVTDSGTVLGPYTVRRGEPARLFRCL